MILQELITRLGFSVDHKPLEHVNHTLESMHHRLEFLAAAEVVRGVWELAERFAGMGEQLETAAITAGITAEEFQKLAYAASQNAVGQEALSAALARMSRKLQAAKDGSQQASESFAKLGINSEQLKGMKNSRDAFYAVADAIDKVDDQQKRLALTQEFFGRGSAKLLKFIQKGSTEYERLGREAEAMGAILGEKGVEDLANFEDAFAGLMLTVKITMAKIGASFAPMFTHIIHDIEHFWAANQKLVRTQTHVWAGRAAYAFGFLYGAIQIVVEAFASFIKRHPVLAANIALVTAALGTFSLAVGTLQLLLGGLVTSFDTLKGVLSLGTSAMRTYALVCRGVASALGFIIIRMGLLIATFFPRLGQAIASFGLRLAVLAANPAVLAVAGVVAGLSSIVLLLQAAWAMLHGKSFKDTWLGQLIDGVADLTGGVFGWLKEKLGIAAKSGESASSLDRGLQGPPLPSEMAPAFLPNGAALLPSFGTGALQDLAQTGIGLDPGARALSPASAPAAAPEPTINLSLNAPITINGVRDAVQAQEDLRASVREVMANSIRELRRNTAPVALR